ncbi:MAG: hypothetical protein MZW92_56410 [Comamonadaceae bacterium]|nr:hypothetical protein [Comamonadaceae bacterium]
MEKPKDYYQLLGVPARRRARPSIKRAFQRLARRLARRAARRTRRRLRRDPGGLRDADRRRAPAPLRRRRSASADRLDRRLRPSRGVPPLATCGGPFAPDEPRRRDPPRARGGAAGDRPLHRRAGHRHVRRPAAARAGRLFDCGRCQGEGKVGATACRCPCTSPAGLREGTVFQVRTDDPAVPLHPAHRPPPPLALSRGAGFALCGAGRRDNGAAPDERRRHPPASVRGEPSRSSERFFDGERGPPRRGRRGAWPRACSPAGALLAFGNGGSAADAQHFVARARRPAVRASGAASPRSPLPPDPSVVTAIGNDLGFAAVFRRQVEAHGRPGDVALGDQHLRPPRRT